MRVASDVRKHKATITTKELFNKFDRLEGIVNGFYGVKDVIHFQTRIQIAFKRNKVLLPHANTTMNHNNVRGNT
jgi:hypothetical protein